MEIQGTCRFSAFKRQKRAETLPAEADFTSYILRGGSKQYYQQIPKNQIEKESHKMSTQNGSNKGMVPEARAAMDRFKMEAASDLDVSAPS